ncbi:Coatomer subunit beta', partial [Ceratobasidium sp. 423]
EKGQNNIAFASLLQLGEAKACAELLVKTDRAPEAALFARTYAPSYAPTAARAWRDDLDGKNKPKIADMIVNPGDNPELFEEGWEAALAREEGCDAPEEKEEQPRGENEAEAEA